MMQSLPSDLWTGLVKEIVVLEGSGRRTGSVGGAHWVEYLFEELGYGRFEVAVEEAEMVEGDK